jgi:membrane-associated phospholipid phosphatase
MNENILLACDLYSIIPIAIYFAVFYMGVYTSNFKESVSFIIFFYVNNYITGIIKKLPYPESLWNVTRRPEGAFNTDYFSRNGPAKKDANGFPSGHMTSVAGFCTYMILRKMGNQDFKEFVRENPGFFWANILLVLLMGFARWYKKCHNLTQIIGGIIYGGVTGYLYYTYIGKELIVLT